MAAFSCYITKTKHFVGRELPICNIDVSVRYKDCVVGRGLLAYLI